MEHPLQYFEDLSKAPVQPGLSVFFDFTNAISDVRIDQSKNNISYVTVNEDGDEITVSQTLTEHAWSNLKRASDKAFDQISKILETQRFDAGQDYLKRVFQRLQYIQTRFCKNSIDPAQQEVVTKVLNHLIKELQQAFLIPPVVSFGSTTSCNKKIKWNSTARQLAAFFYELENEVKTTKGQPYLEIQGFTLQEFILEHFVNAEGDPFSPDTINTNLRPDKSDNRKKQKKAAEILDRHP
jgi:hypothetical protein